MVDSSMCIVYEWTEASLQEDKELVNRDS